MSDRLKTQAEEHNDVNLLFSQLEGVLKHLGTVLGQPPLEQLLKAQGQIEAKHNSEQFADSGLTAGREPAFAQRSPKREGRKSFKIGQAEARDQKWETQLLKSKYLRVSGIRNQEGRTMWRTQTTFPGKRSWDPHSEWLYFPTETEAAQAADLAIMRFALAQPDRAIELIGMLSFPLAHYVAFGTIEEEATAVGLLDGLLRLPKLSPRNGQRVVDAYIALRAKRDAASRGGRAAGPPDLCNIVHPRNGLAGSLADAAAQQDSDHSSGFSDLPDGVIKAAETQRGSCSPRRAQPTREQGQTGQQEPASTHNRDGAAAGHGSSTPSMSADEPMFTEQDIQGGGEGPSDARPEADRDPDITASSNDWHDTSSAPQDDRDDGASCAADSETPQAEDQANVLERLAEAAVEASMQPNQQSSSQLQAEAAQPRTGPPPPPPPSASLLDEDPLQAHGNAMPEPEPDQGGGDMEEGLEEAASESAAPDVVPLEQPEASGQPSTTSDPSTSSGSFSTGSSDSGLRNREGQAAHDSEAQSSWGARSGHVRGGRGTGTEADPVVLSSDSDEEEEEEEEDEDQALKRRRTETFASPGVVKPEKPVPKQQPTLADLLHLYRDPRSGAQGRPGSLRRPSMPLFESLRRPPPGVGGDGAALQFEQGIADSRQQAPVWRAHVAPSPAPMSGLRSQAGQVPRYAGQQAYASPATPAMPHRPFASAGSQQQSRPPGATPFSGMPFSAFRQAPAGASAPWASRAQSSRPPQQTLHAEAAAVRRPWQPSGSFEFVDLDSSSGEGEGVSWREDGGADAESAPEDGPEPQSAKSHQQPTPPDRAAHAQGPPEMPQAPVLAPGPNDTTGLVIERDRAAMAAVEAKEWELRRVEIERQAEEARREKKRRRAESELAVRSQARLEDHWRLLAAQESEADERERLRMEIRAQLELRVRYARSAESKLRALNIPLEYDPVTRLPNISKAVRSSLRFYHPDRYQNVGLRAQVEAEEMFKLVSRVRNP